MWACFHADKILLSFGANGKTAIKTSKEEKESREKGAGTLERTEDII